MNDHPPGADNHQRNDGPPRRLVLVDGSSYLYRAFHAGGDWHTEQPDGTRQPTGAIRIMISMMQGLRRDLPATWGVCVFDAPGPTFRDALYADYKATRSAMPADLALQIEPIHDVVRLLGWPVLAVPGVEADDVIGTLAVAAARQGIDVIVVSGDKDLAQLVDAHITVLDTMSGKRRDIAGVQAEFGVQPSQMLDYQTLVGDAIDNVPGVAKVGPKTAVKWLNEYGSLDVLVARAAEIKGAAGQHLRDAVDWLPKGRELLKIRTDCELEKHLEGYPALDSVAISARQESELVHFYEKFGFKSLLRNPAAAPAPTGAAALVEAAPAAPREVEVRYETILDWPALDRWLERLQAAELAAVDTETTSLDEMRADIVGISFSIEPGEAAYVPLTHDYPDAPAQLPRDEVLDRLRPWLENPARAKLGQNVKYDRHVFANHGIDVRGYVHDTMLQSYVLEVHKPHGLSSLAERHLGRGGTTYEDLCGKGVNQIPFSQVSIDKATNYSCEDSDQTLDVHRTLWPRIEADEKLRAVYALEIETSETLFQIERAGVLIDAAQLAAQSRELGQRIVELEQQAHDLAGQPFNLGSPKQIGEIFFKKLGLPVIKKTASGAPSTDEEVLEKLAEDYPLPARILEHRGLAKLKGTYTDKLAQLALPRTGRVHTHYAQAVAITGRLASSDPNLQNIPIRTREGRRIREAFVAPPGSQIASADYSQIELRIMAHISGDAALLAAFSDRLDVHRATASEVFGVPLADVTGEQRRYAKTINFGLIYGMSSYGLARALAIDNTAAKNYIERYFQRYPGVKRYMDEMRQSARTKGYVETVLGRRLVLPEINSPNGPRRAGAERLAINAPMQGTAADLIKLSMNAVQRLLDDERRATRMILQVHDELVFEVPDAEVEWVREAVPRVMAGVADLKVPLLAEIGFGPNWEQAH